MMFVTHNIAEAIYLSHSIAILSGGRIADTIRVGLPSSRVAAIRSTPEFAAEYGRVQEVLMGSEV
jgi:NitT/TauT family transport system ATP-binding protein